MGHVLVSMSASESESLTPDDVFEILSNHRRRMVLYYLRKHGETADVKDLAEGIAAMENEVAVEELTNQQRKRVYVSLYQTHLPKMAESGVIEYDKEAGTVGLTEQTTAIDRYLAGDERSSYPWSIHYLSVTVLGGAFLALSVADVAIFAALSPLWVGVVVLSLLVTSAVVQYWYAQKREAEIPLELTEFDR